MADPTIAELAARMAVVETRLGITPTPTPVPTPTPTPGSGVPAAPSGFHITMLADGRPQLDWDPDADAGGPSARAGVKVLDLLNPTDPVKDTVLAGAPQRSIRSVIKPGTRRSYALQAYNGAGVSDLSVAIDVPLTAPPPPPSPAPLPVTDAPGSLLNLDRWYLTLPIADPSGRDTSGPWDVYQPELKTFVHGEFFRTGTDLTGQRYVEYISPAKGVTTSGSGATRTELRQMSGPNRGDKASFSFTDGKPHALTCTLTCDGTSIAGRKEVTVGQIHGPGGTPPLMLVVNHTRDGALEVFQQGHRQSVDLLTGLRPGEKFTYRIDATNGVRVYAARGGLELLPDKPGFDWAASVFTEQTGLYMKAGAYNKELASNNTAGQSVVRHYRLDLV